MRQVTIGGNEAGQRLDKFLHKYLNEAGNSFLYKMLRKKNITLNGKKAEGKEKLQEDDTVEFFLSEETLIKFSGGDGNDSEAAVEEYEAAYQALAPVPVLYENRHILLVDKPAGMLSQKARPEDISLNEWLCGYLIKSGDIAPESLKTFRPSVCNRLDRNTSGIVICGKSLYGSQTMSALLRTRELRKFYRLFAAGRMRGPESIKGYLVKDEVHNKVEVSAVKYPGSAGIETRYEPLSLCGDMTYLEVELLTGKTHQIRAHLSSVGYPLLGDHKYGNKKINEECRKKFGVTYQLLHAYRLEFPEMEAPMSDMSRMVVTAPLPAAFERLAREPWQPGIREV